MKVSEFKRLYEHAQRTYIVEDDTFNCGGYIWIQLTNKQHMKMYNLMLEQGAKEIINAKGVKQIKLANGLGIVKIGEC